MHRPSVRSFFIYAIAAIFLCYEMALQTSPSVMVDYLMRDLHINAMQLGFMAGCYFCTYTIMQIPAGLLFDRVQVRYLLPVAILICASGAFLFGASSSAWIAAAGRLLMGVGSAFAFIGVLVVATHWFPSRFFAFLVGVAQLLAALGALGGEAPLVSLLHRVGWRATIHDLAVAGVVIAILVFIIIPKRKCTPVVFTERMSVGRGLKSIFQNTQTWWVALYALCMWGPMVIFAALWGVPFLARIHAIGDHAAANAVAMIWIGLGIMSPLLGWISSILCRRCILLSGCALLGLFASLAVIYLAHLPMGWVMVMLFCFGIATSGQILSFAVVRDLNRAEVIATAIGLNNMAVVAGGILFQPLVGYILQLHWNGLMQNGVPIYSAQDYTFALFLVPLCFFVAWIAAQFFIKETHCKGKESQAGNRGCYN